MARVVSTAPDWGDDRDEVLDGLGLTDTELATRGFLRLASEAQTDLSSFYELVMRHELTKEPLRPAPHQRLMFSFIAHHPWCVIRTAVGTGKTFSVAAVALWLLGNDVTQRGAIVSKTQDQASKVLGMMSDYITEPALNAPLTLTFPWLQPSPRIRDQWTRTKITVDRDPGIRDPSVVAVGYDGAIAGARLSWLVTDDLIDDENSYTPGAREVVRQKFDGRLMSRLDPHGSRAIVCNTPWHQEDQTYHLETKVGWPTLTMDVYGFVRFSNVDAAWLRNALDVHVRPSRTRVMEEHEWYRLREHDPDPEEEVPLWPDRYGVERIHELRYGGSTMGGMLPHEFAKLYLCSPFDEEGERCQRDWVERCKRRGLGTTMVSQYDGPHPTYTGIDLAIGEGKQHDRTVFFTFVREPDGSKRILDIEGGRFSGPAIVDKCIEKSDRYGSALRVENVQGQDYIRQFAIDKRKDLLIKPHTTGSINKSSKDFGVESVFTDMQQGAWIIPCDDNGKCHPEVQRWIDDCLYYQPPPAHTGDYLMSSWFAREAARRGYRNDPRPRHGKQRQLINEGGF